MSCIFIYRTDAWQFTVHNHLKLINGANESIALQIQQNIKEYIYYIKRGVIR